MELNKLTRFYNDAKVHAELFSPDPSTKVAAFFISESGVVITEGVNSPPAQCKMQACHWERPIKYDWLEHAERNAIFNLIRPYLNGAIAYVNYTLTIADVRALIQVGVTAVVSSVVQAIKTHDMVMIHDLDSVPIRFIQPYTEIMDNRIKEADYRAKAWSKVELNPQGCIITDKHNRLLAMGYNGLVRGADDSMLEGMALDSLEIESAVRNALYNVARLKGLEGSIAVVTFMPCSDCCRAIIQTGCNKLVTERPLFITEAELRWKEHFEKSLAIIESIGMEVIFV